ncbi:MAG TPA: histidine kinase dimerization/phospho-acceptor domain-containing protein [Terriglobales bacterium]|nr:histidine kinase dimerization/phospho-acceptor domain-containing protein [Terriglobales bacterium]
MTRLRIQAPTALIISDDGEFSRSITGRWQMERNAPAFTLVSSDVGMGFDPEGFQLAVVGRVRPQTLSPLLESLAVAGKHVIFLSEDPVLLQRVRDRWPGILLLKQEENWLATLMLVCPEALYRAYAEAQMAEIERINSTLAHEATLGRYVCDMRHTLNNMLTAMLGNSELLLLEPGSLSSEARSQIETIRNMALRIHEILRRFSSLEKELTVAEQEAGKELIEVRRVGS